MNRIYRVVKNKNTGQWVAASELSTGQSKAGNTKKLLASSVAGALLSLTPIVSWAADIITTGDNDPAISETASGTNNIEVTNSDELTTNGKYSAGIYALSTGTGKITVTNSGNILTTENTGISDADSSHAIYAVINNSGATTGGIEIIQTGGTLTTHNYNATGVRAASNAISGDIDITVSNAIIDVKGENSDGIYGSNSRAGSNVNINITTNGGEIKVLDGTASKGSANYGIVIVMSGAASTGNAVIKNNGTTISTGLGANGDAVASSAITATISDKNSTGFIDIFNSGTLSTQGSGSGTSAIRAENTGSGTVNVTNTGDITTSGAQARGINAVSAGGKVIINNAGNITTNNTSAHGIFAQTTGDANEINITNDGIIHIKGDSSRGIFSTGENGTTITVTNNGDILHDVSTAFQYGIEVRGGDNTIKIITNNGKISGSNYGIVAWNGSAIQTGAKSIINVGAQGSIDALTAIAADMSDENTINIAQGAVVNGKTIALLLRSLGTATPKDTVNNAGTITSDRDQILRTAFLTPGATLEFNNDGHMTGYITLDNVDTTMTNSATGTWEMRTFYDYDYDGVRDIKKIAVSNFGNGNNSFTNEGVVRLATVSGQRSTNIDGEYIPNGALSSAQDGIVHAHMLNLGTFKNAGTIDMTANGQAGDVFVISGGGTAGTYGGGEYISNGGSIKLDTVLNKGGSISQSDILVVDNVRLGTAATKIIINPIAGGTAELTEGDGIKLIEVLGTQDARSFELGAPVSLGGYEYLLFSDGENGEDGWYLRNYLKATDGDGNETPLSKLNWYRNPNIGSYLGNQFAAANMFQQNILDRRDNVRAPDQTLWLRVNHNELETDILGGLQYAEIETNLFQIGADLFKHNGFVAGVYAGYGDSKIDNRSNQTGTTADGRVTGYHVGAYGSWMPEVDKGPYADVWGYYAWYDNKLSGAAQQYRDSKYSSTGYAFSAEVGYGFELNKKEDGSAWIIEPHAQATYSKINADNFYDNSFTHYSNNRSSGIQTRLGTRVYRQIATDQKGVSPFIEINWLHNNMDNSIRLNDVSFNSNIGKNVGEVKIGIQGQLTDKVSIFSHMGIQQGSEGYKRQELQIGLGWNW